MAKTFWQIKTQGWASINQRSTSTTFSTTIMWAKINEVIKRVCNGRYKNILTGQIIRAWKLSFMNTETSIRTLSWWDTTADLEIIDTELDIDTTFLNSSGYVLINNEVIAYTWKSATQLTWVSGQTVKHDSWSKVYQLYTLPTNFNKPNKIIIAKTGQEIPEYTWDNCISYKIRYSWTDTILELQNLDNDTIITIDYLKKVTDMSDDADETIIADEYALLMWDLAWGELWYTKGLTMSERVLNDAYSRLQWMFQYYTNTRNVIKQSIKPQARKHYSIRR